jgi:hypothetical protein
MSHLIDDFGRSSLGTAQKIASDHGLEFHKIAGNEREAKAEVLRRIGPRLSAAMGNGFNDCLMLREAALGICVLGKEGASTEALLASHIAVTSPADALELLLVLQRLMATLRGLGTALFQRPICTASRYIDKYSIFLTDRRFPSSPES